MIDPTPDPLALALDFSPEELALNRNGRLSARQQQALSQMAGRTRTRNILIVALVDLTLLLIAGVIAAGAYLELGPLAGLAGSDPLLPLIMFASLLAVDVILSLAFALTLRRSHLAARVVRRVSGPAALETVAVGGRLTNRLKIGRQSFHVSDPVYQAFRPTRPYDVYYVKIGRRPVIVAAEETGPFTAPT